MDPCIMQIVSLCHEKAPINTLRVPLQKYILPYPTYRQLWLCSPQKQIHKCWTYEVDICEFVCVWDEGESYWNERNAKKFSKTPHLSLAAAAAATFKSKLEMDSDQGRQGAPFQFKTWEFPKKTVFEIWIKVLPGKTMVSSASLLTMHCNGTHPDEKQQENKTQKDFKAISKVYVKGSTRYATSGQNSTRPLRWIGNRGKTANLCQVGSLFQICICFLL